jgi:hypothetical protein
MRYLLLIYGDERRVAEWTPEQMQADFKAYEEYTGWLQDRGWMHAGDALQPTGTATTVRVRNGDTLTTDGPFAETKEQLGGYYLIECENLDQAIEAAARVPAARGGSIEIRPVMEVPSSR